MGATEGLLGEEDVLARATAAQVHSQLTPNPPVLKLILERYCQWNHIVAA